MDRLDSYRLFLQVIDSASFSRAADLSGVSRSSVSVAIQTLESRLGVRLLNRTTRRVIPTQEGLAFYERCRRLLEDVEETEALFHAARTPEGRLRVDLPGRIGRRIVAPRLPEFLDRYPGLDVMLGVTDRAIDLLDEGADCVLRVGSLPDSGLIARSIGDLPIATVASPAYLERHGTADRPSDLDAHVAVHYCSPKTGRIEPFEWIEDGTVRTRALSGRVAVNGAEAYIACCLAGLGLIQVPAYDVRDHLKAGELVEILSDYRAAPMPMALLFPHRRHLPRRTEVFADWLTTIISQATHY